MMKSIIYSAFILVLLASCASVPPENIDRQSATTDYKLLDNWAAHPDKKDLADLVPAPLTSVDQSMLEADVFFVHPTTYTTKTIGGAWNAPVNNQELNGKTEKTTIQYQGSAFNQAGRIFAPRYRQAHISAYFTEDKELSKDVFDIAYNDVKAAFEQYISKYNNGRPFIIASHSQGTTHCGRLIKEVIDGSSLQKQMIAAYLVGMPVPKDAFKSIKPCSTSDDTGCFVSWRTYKKGYTPEDVILGDAIAIHNPLNWKTDNSYVSKDQNKGAIIRNFDKLITEATDAQISNGILMAAKPKFALSFLFTSKNYHVADINFYYMNIRENAVERVETFMKN